MEKNETPEKNDASKEKNEASNRPMAPHSSSLRLYKDNYDDITTICRHTGRKQAEEIRDLVDEALLARRLGYGGGLLFILNKYEELLDRNTREKQSLTLNMREFYGLLLETLAASIGARRMSWNYLARTVLKQSGYSDDQIGDRYEAEMQACVEERDLIADELEQAMDGLASGERQSGEARTDSPASPAGLIPEEKTS